MSNKVGELYDIIINNVVNETRNDFEESGEDPSVLEMLKSAWKKRLKEMNVTKEPLWESPDKSNPVMLNVGNQSLDVGLNMPGMTGIPPPQGTINPISPMGTNVNGSPSNPIKGPQNPTASNFSLQSSISPPVGVNMPPRSSYGYSSQTNGGVPMQSMPSNIPPAPGSIPVSASTTIPSTSGINTSADNTSAQPNMDMPSNQTLYNPLQPANGSQASRQVNLSPQLQNDIHNAMRNPNVPQTDGNQDEELNSDLDDSEDELNSAEEDDDNDQTQIMLCLYEKVHKVKTRWKYSLKDGVANINGLDYVFSKGNGESEW